MDQEGSGSLRRGPILWAHLSLWPRPRIPWIFGIRGTAVPRLRLCAALCWSLDAVRMARAGHSGLLPSAGREARLGGDPGCKGRRKTPLGVKPRSWRAFFAFPPGASLSTCRAPRPPGCGRYRDSRTFGEEGQDRDSGPDPSHAVLQTTLAGWGASPVHVRVSVPTAVCSDPG